MFDRFEKYAEALQHGARKVREFARNAEDARLFSYAMGCVEFVASRKVPHPVLVWRGRHKLEHVAFTNVRNHDDLEMLVAVVLGAVRARAAGVILPYADNGAQMVMVSPHTTCALTASVEQDQLTSRPIGVLHEVGEGLDVQGDLVDILRRVIG